MFIIAPIGFWIFMFVLMILKVAFIAMLFVLKWTFFLLPMFLIKIVPIVIKVMWLFFYYMVIWPIIMLFKLLS